MDRITPNELKIISEATNSNKREGTFSISGVGFVRAEDFPGFGHALDLLMKVEGCETVLVYGVSDMKEILGSFRTVNATVEAKTWLESIFGSTLNVTFDDKSQVDFSIPLGIWAKSRDKQALWSITKMTIEDLFLDKIGRLTSEE